TNNLDINPLKNIFNQLNDNKFDFNDIKTENDEDEQIFEVLLNTSKPVIKMIKNTNINSSKYILLPTLNGVMIEDKDNMNKPRLIINPKFCKSPSKVIIDTGSSVSLINRKHLSSNMKDNIQNLKTKIKFPLLNVEETISQTINIRIDDRNYNFIITDLDIIDILIGNDILFENSIIDQEKKIIKIDCRNHRINYEKSSQFNCFINVANCKKVENPKFNDDDDIIEQITEIVENLPSTICDIISKQEPTEDEIQVIRDYIFETFDDVVVEKLPEMTEMLNASRRSNTIHSIEIKPGHNIEPTKKLIYYSSDDQKKAVEEMVVKFMELGIIEKSKSNYSSPIMLLKKRDSWRVVHDYRQLNKVTVRDDHPFAPADSLLGQCKDSKIFSKFDMLMGFYQIAMNPEHKHYTAFTTHIGKFHYKRMPQGLVNSPSTFARMMIEIFGKIKSLLQYFDDLMVHTKPNYKKHIIEVIRVLLYCRKYLIYISKEKSEIFKTQIDFLGFQIGKDGISPRAAKVRTISELPNPRNSKEAEAALGLFGFFRRVIEKYAEKTIHLSAEAKGKGNTKLSEDAIKEFINLKNEFNGDNIIALPIEQDNKPVDIEKLKESSTLLIVSDMNNLNNGSYHLYCDASDRALSGVLYQIQGNSFKPIWFHSRKFSDTQKRYSIGDREFLAIIDSLKKFQYLLLGKKVTIYSDHQNLTYIINKSNDKPFTKRQDGYMKYIKEFEYELKHISGKQNGIADFLSRKYDNFQWDEPFLNKIKEEQDSSEWLKEMKNNPNMCIQEINGICYLVEDGNKKLIITEKDTIDTILNEYHDSKYSGHHAVDITYNNIRNDYYFKQMFTIIKRYIKSCAICQLNINRKDNGLLQSLEIPFEVWRDISIDFLSLPKTPYTFSGFIVEVDQVCVIVCRLSKMVHIVPCSKTITAEQTADLLLNHVFRLHGYPRTIVSDRDPRFLSEIWTLWAKTMDSKLKMTVAYRAQGDGQTERMNREIIRMLRKIAEQYGESWAGLIPLVEFALNSASNKSTKMSPFQVVYGFNPPTPVNHFNTLTKNRIPMSNIKKIVRDNILDAQVASQKYYNKKRGGLIFVVGEKVLVKRKYFKTSDSTDLISHKLESKNCGPFKIIEINGNNVTLDTGYPKRNNVFNMDQLVKLYEDEDWLRDEISMPDPEEMEDGEEEYEVEKILNHDKRNKLYLVKWKGYPSPTWNKEIDLTNCEDVLREYWKDPNNNLNSKKGRDEVNKEAMSSNSSSKPSNTPKKSKASLKTIKNKKSSKSKNKDIDTDDNSDVNIKITKSTTRSGRVIKP
ncbi:hypothetical protein DICPUDRAFT_15082, partial [Dictyostelium purpureum]